MRISDAGAACAVRSGDVEVSLCRGCAFWGCCCLLGHHTRDPSTSWWTWHTVENTTSFFKKKEKDALFQYLRRFFSTLCPMLSGAAPDPRHLRGKRRILEAAQEGLCHATGLMKSARSPLLKDGSLYFLRCKINMLNLRSCHFFKWAQEYVRSRKDTVKGPGVGLHPMASSIERPA